MFSKKESDFYKGIAIILMLFHHLFNDFEEYASYTVSYWPFNADRIQYWALLAKICVAIFVFISGYGLSASYDRAFGTKEPDSREITSFIGKRLWKLMTVYWFAFLLTLLCQPLGRTIIDAYGSSLKEIILYLTIDVCGLSFLFSTPTLNPTWWYMTLAIAIILIMPFILRIMNKMGTIVTAALLCMILYMTGLTTPSTFYLFSMLFGAACFRIHIFEKADAFAKKSKYHTLGLLIGEVLMFFILLSYRTHYNFNGFMDGLIAVSLALLVHSVLFKIPVITNILQLFGKHSANIFLMHNQIYSFYFLGFFYSFRHWALILAALLLVCLPLSIAMEFVQKNLIYKLLFPRKAS